MAWIITFSDNTRYVYCGTSIAAKSFAEAYSLGDLTYTILELTEGHCHRL